MKISELKVGDLIKYKTPDTYQKEGFVLTTSHVTKILDEQVVVAGDSLTGSVYYVLNKNIVSKLEPIFKNRQEIRDKIIVATSKITSNVSSFEAAQISIEILELANQLNKIEYKEILIEKEENIGRFYICKKCHVPIFIKEDTKIDKEKFLNYICDECKKSAPKSFKFEIGSMRKFSIDYDYYNSFLDYHYPQRSTGGKITIEFNDIKFLDSNSYLCDPKKSYTIEIKEKNE